MIFVNAEVYDSIKELVQIRAKIIERWKQSKKKHSRKQYTLAEKIAIDRKFKADIEAVEQQIENLEKQGVQV